MILIDYKMKFEPIYFREKTTEHFGEKGLSWHGAIVYYRSPEEPHDRKISYYDHISTGDSKQDWIAVLSIIEATVMQLKNEVNLPLVRVVKLPRV